MSDPLVADSVLLSGRKGVRDAFAFAFHLQGKANMAAAVISPEKAERTH